MVERYKLVGRYTARRLTDWKMSRNDGRVKAELAMLRRGVGRKPGDMPEIWGVLFEGFPEELMSASGEPTRAEWAVSTALSLYALHQQGYSVTEKPMTAQGASLGQSVRRLAKNDEDMERVLRRFNAFATADDMKECAHHLRGLVQLLRAEGIPLDYPALASDLYQFQTAEGAQRVRLRWGQDFYRYRGDADNDDVDTDDITNTDEGKDDSNA